jgi:hypothetical protein
MLRQFAMPTREQVRQALLRTLLKHGGVVKEFAAGQQVVEEIADQFELTKAQRTAALETVYRKQNRVKKALLWHRLLFRAADSLANGDLVSRPTQTFQLTGEREWMLTEGGFDQALRISRIPVAEKEFLPIKSFEVQKLVKKMVETERPKIYQPFDTSRKRMRKVREVTLRLRGFRQAVIEIYDYRCAVCGLKINSPDSLCWEVEAAHIVPHASFGKDDIFNGIALCRFHHWAFDAGWFGVLDDYTISLSSKLSRLPAEFGRIGRHELIRSLARRRSEIRLPSIRMRIPFAGIGNSFFITNFCKNEILLNLDERLRRHSTSRLSVFGLHQPNPR